MKYEYKCECGKKKEFEYSMKDDESRKKPHYCDCGKEMQRVFSTFRWHFVY